MKALLINPPTGLYVREDRCQSYVDDFIVAVNRPPMDLMMMAASLEAIGIVCKIKDYPAEGEDWKILKKDLLNFKPDLLILSVTTPTLKEDMYSCSIAKEINSKILTIVKGAHFLAYDYEVLTEFKDLDVIIRGESELVIKEIATSNNFEQIKGITFRANGQIKRNENRPFLENLDELPLPARHLVENNMYIRPDTSEVMAVIETNRGCPKDCIFCLVKQVSGKKIRSRSVEVIVNEIEECINRFKISNFHFKADTFTWNKNWVIELCKEILKRKLKIQWLCNSRVDTLDQERIEWMKRAGCWAISLGIESGNQEILNQIKKDITLEECRGAIKLCKKFRIKSYAYFIIGFPWDTEKTINDSIKFAIELEPDFVDFFLPYPFPGTELEKIAKENRFTNESVGARAYTQPLMGTLYLSQERLVNLKMIALRRYYLRPKYIFQKLLTAKSPMVFSNYCYYGCKTLIKLFNNVYREKCVES